MAANHARHNAKPASGSPTHRLCSTASTKRGKPRAACFAARDAALAKKAAGLMGLTVLPVAGPQQDRDRGQASCWPPLLQRSWARAKYSRHALRQARRSRDRSPCERAERQQGKRPGKSPLPDDGPASGMRSMLATSSSRRKPKRSWAGRRPPSRTRAATCLRCAGKTRQTRN